MIPLRTPPAMAPGRIARRAAIRSDLPGHPAIRLALLLIAAVCAAGLAPSPTRAAIPNRVYGSVTLNGSPAPLGTQIEALTEGKRCGSAAVTPPDRNGNAYILDVPDWNAAPECKPGAIITFTVGAVTAAQSFTLDDLGSFHRINLTAPGTPNVPAGATSAPTPRTVALPTGCTDLISGFPEGTAPAVVAAAVAPPQALSGIWRWDAARSLYFGYSPNIVAASDLTAINRGDTLRLCTTEPASITVPA